MRQHTLALCADVIALAREQSYGGDFLAQLVRVRIQAQQCIECGQRHFVHTQRALHRIFTYFGDELFGADHQTGLRATQQFVAAEGDEISAIGQRFLGCRFVRQAVVFEVDQHATA